jgi:hypothetical protein
MRSGSHVGHGQERAVIQGFFFQAMYFVVDDRTSEQLVTHVMTQYNAVGTDHLLTLMRRAGFTQAERLNGRFYQPVLVGNREA